MNALSTFDRPRAVACGGGRSGPVRVSYFDPRTGEPCESKPEPLHGRQARESWCQRAFARSCERGRKRRPVMVDGVRHASIAAAARAMGCDKGTLGNALRAGAKEFGGRKVAYAEEGAEG